MFHDTSRFILRFSGVHYPTSTIDKNTFRPQATFVNGIDQEMPQNRFSKYGDDSDDLAEDKESNVEGGSGHARY